MGNQLELPGIYVLVQERRTKGTKVRILTNQFFALVTHNSVFLYLLTCDVLIWMTVLISIFQGDSSFYDLVFVPTVYVYV